MDSRKSFLSQEYPAPKGERVDVIISLAFGAFIGFFMVFFEPFDLNVLEYDYKALKVAFYGVITGVNLLIFLYLIPRVAPSLFEDRHWRIKHQLFYFGIIMFAISTSNGLYINYLNDLDFSWTNYGWIIIRTYAIGSIPLTVVILAVYNQRLKNYLLEANELNKAHLDHSQQGDEALIIQLENGKDELVLNTDTLLYMKAEGNYLYAYQRVDEALTKSLHRVSLSSVMDQIALPHIQRCHRSYIVNLSQVEEFTGNAQGLKLELEAIEESIPVSRKYIDEVRAYFLAKN